MVSGDQHLSKDFLSRFDEDKSGGVSSEELVNHLDADGHCFLLDFIGFLGIISGSSKSTSFF